MKKAEIIKNGNVNLKGIDLKEKDKVYVTNIPDIGNVYVGDKIPVKTWTWIKVMAYVDGYVMGRYKGCMAFADSLEAFKKRVQSEK